MQTRRLHLRRVVGQHLVNSSLGSAACATKVGHVRLHANFWHLELSVQRDCPKFPAYDIMMQNMSGAPAVSRGVSATFKTKCFNTNLNVKSLKRKFTMSAFKIHDA